MGAGLALEPGRYYPPRHVIQRIVNPPFSTYMASYDVVSNICQALGGGERLCAQVHRGWGWQNIACHVTGCRFIETSSTRVLTF